MFLGAGASLFGRPAEFTFQGGGEYLPNGGELAEHLAQSFGYVPNDFHDLLGISQYVALTFGQGRLYETLRERNERGVHHEGVEFELDDWGSATSADPFAFLDPRAPRFRFARGD